MLLVDPDNYAARRGIGIEQTGWQLRAVSPCHLAQIGWLFSGKSMSEGYWFCDTCKTPLVRLAHFRDDGFEDNAKSSIEVFNGSGWASFDLVREWIAAWLKCSVEDIWLTFELVET